MYGYSSKAFIYSLNNDNGSGHAVYNPVKLQVRSYRRSSAVYLCASTGPRFGSHDIYIYQTTLQVTIILTLDVVEATPSL